MQLNSKNHLNDSMFDYDYKLKENLNYLKSHNFHEIQNLIFFSSSFSGLVSEQASKMAKTRKAVCIWCRCPGAWHGLPLVTPGLFSHRYLVPDDVPPRHRTCHSPRYLLAILPGLSTSHAVLSLCSSECSTCPLSRSPGMCLFL